MPLKEKKSEDSALIVIAEEADDSIGDMLQDMIPVPERPYKGSTVAALADAVRRVVALMDRELEERPYPEPVPELDADLLRFLAAALAAADDYGQPAPVSPEEVRGDNELIVLTQHLLKLAQDRDFKTFLDEELQDMTEEELQMQAPSSEPADPDALFMSRM